MNIFTWVLITALSVCIGFEIMIYSSPESISPMSINFQITDRNETAVKYSLNSSSLHSSDFTLVVFSACMVNPYTTLYIYYDPSYQQASAINNKAIRPIVDYIASEIEISHYNVDVNVIDSNRLSKLLQNMSNSNTALIVPTGAFPDTAFTRTLNLVKPWISNGGTLIWIGSSLGYYSSQMKASELDYKNPWHPQLNGTIDFFGEQIIGYNEMNATSTFQNKYSESLNLDYSDIARAPSIAAVKSRGGLILGKTSDAFSSISLLPLGAGKVVIFGGMMKSSGHTFSSDQLTIAKDIVQLLRSGALSSKDIVLSKQIKLNANEEIEEWINLNKNNDYDCFNTEYIIIYIYELTPTKEGKYFKTLYLKMPK
jgi:hypothetical protein